MRIVRTTDELKSARSQKRGLVPTMGAFHEGHLSLMRTAREECDEVVVSLFVNPLQFGPNEDLSRYPRQEERDAAMAESTGVDILFAPSPETMIASQRARVRVEGVSDRYEGAHRPGHFDGVATIVAKLFHMVEPQIAYFGLKDRQQCAVIEAMTEDLNFPLALSMQPTVREKDGLAMSSRNAYLSPEDRQIAPTLYATLQASSSALRHGEPVRGVLDRAIQRISQAGFAVDYLDLVNPRTFEAVDSPDANSVIVTAAKLGKTRLIDNVDVFASG